MEGGHLWRDRVLARWEQSPRSGAQPKNTAEGATRAEAAEGPRPSSETPKPHLLAGAPSCPPTAPRPAVSCSVPVALLSPSNSAARGTEQRAVQTMVVRRAHRAHYHSPRAAPSAQEGRGNEGTLTRLHFLPSAPSLSAQGGGQAQRPTTNTTPPRGWPPLTAECTDTSQKLGQRADDHVFSNSYRAPF